MSHFPAALNFSSAGDNLREPPMAVNARRLSLGAVLSHCR